MHRAPAFQMNNSYFYSLVLKAVFSVPINFLPLS